MNRHESLCEQKVVRKAKLTKLAFNPRGASTPVLLVGDDHGGVVSLKLSPNLRWTAVSKAAAEAAAKAEQTANAQPGPRRGAPKRLVSANGTDRKDTSMKEKETSMKDPIELEVEKLNRIVAVAIKDSLWT